MRTLLGLSPRRVDHLYFFLLMRLLFHPYTVSRQYVLPMLISLTQLGYVITSLKEIPLCPTTVKMLDLKDRQGNFTQIVKIIICDLRCSNDNPVSDKVDLIKESYRDPSDREWNFVFRVIENDSYGKLLDTVLEQIK